jgi:hypothetical protein
MNTFVDDTAIFATSSGAGPFTLGSAVPGFFGREQLVDGAVYSYAVQQGGNVERGSGTYVASSGTLSRNVQKSTNGNVAVAFDVNAIVAFTFGASDIVDLLVAASGTGPTAKAAFNAYGLQWAVWFNGTPAASELLSLFSIAVAMEFQPNFALAATAPPLTPPAAEFVMNVDHQVGGSGAWTTVGTITLAVDGTVSLATVGGAAVPLSVGDRLRVVAPASVDSAVAGFAVTFKGYIP